MTSAIFEDSHEAARYSEYRIAQMREYGVWVAAGPIYVDGVLAFLEGYPVPESTVRRYGWDQQNLVRPADAPPPDPDAIRAAAKRRRLEQLDAERAALAAELGEDHDTGDTEPGVDADQADAAADKPAAKSARAKAKE